MVIGNTPKASLSLVAPQYTMAAVIANEFTEAADQLYLDALVEIGLVLFVVTVAINALSRLLIWRVGSDRRVRQPRAAAASATQAASGT
jgi:phosphate transport system permease protein